MVQGLLSTARKVTQLVCVLALAVASLLHVCLDAQSVEAAGPAFALASDSTSDAGDATHGAESCHSCSVVSFFALADVPRAAPPLALIPAGSVLHVIAFLQPTTAPPPRT